MDYVITEGPNDAGKRERLVREGVHIKTRRGVTLMSGNGREDRIASNLIE